MTEPVSAEEAARRYPTLAWCNRELFAIVGARGAPPSRAAATAALARHLAEHAQRWESLVPESVLLAPLVRPGPPDETAQRLVASLGDRDDLVGALTDEVVPWLRSTYQELDRRLPDHAEGAARRLIRDALADLDAFAAGAAHGAAR